MHVEHRAGGVRIQEAEVATLPSDQESRLTDSTGWQHFKIWFPPALILATFVSLTVWSWRKWPDVFVDFGQQVYTPWQLASGKILFRDQMYLAGGPLSQYVHALIFSLFGVSLTVLVVFNLCLLLFFMALLYRLFLSVADRWTATAVCLVTLLVFSFSQYVRNGNYNYVCPYLYEAFHGLVLSVGAIVCLHRWLITRRNGWAFGAGLLCGAVFLTKPDLYLAALITLGIAISIYWITSGFHFKDTAWPIIFLVAGHAAPMAVVVVYYTLVWSFRGGLIAVAAAWLPVLTTSVPQNAFYKWCLGLDRPWVHLTHIFEYFAGFCLVTAFLAICSRYLTRRSVPAMALLGVVLLTLVYLATGRFRWELSGRALLPLMLLSCGLIAWRWWGQHGSATANVLVLPLLWSVFALMLLGKMGLNTRIWHYGFYLAMPAVVFVVFSLLWMIPGELEKSGTNPFAFRVLVTIFLGIGAFQLLMISGTYYQAKDFSVGEDGDRIVTYKRSQVPQTEGIQLAVDWLRQNTGPTSTVATMPGGMLINYLARRPNPTRFPAISPLEFISHSEAQILAAYVQNSPDYIVLIHYHGGEFGVGYFGQDPAFGMNMMRWIRSNYLPVWQYGDEPFRTARFGMRIMARRTNLTVPGGTCDE